MKYFSLQPAMIDAEAGDDHGLIVRVDDRIVAIFTKLSADCHGQLRGHWFLEAGFGRCAAHAVEPFESLSLGLAYLAQRLGADIDVLQDELALADREFGSSAT